ncbi:hypothetical protein CF319_g9330 [Tilletia indica]|nr:hypothetical protein CF319_g9330 [Tilletia indica]
MTLGQLLTPFCVYQGGGHWWPWQERNLRAAEEAQRVDMEEPTTMKTLIADIAAAIRASMAGVSGPVVGEQAQPRRAEPVAAPAPAAPASPPVRSIPPPASRNAEPDPLLYDGAEDSRSTRMTMMYSMIKMTMTMSTMASSRRFDPGDSDIAKIVSLAIRY